MKNDTETTAHPLSSDVHTFNGSESFSVSFRADTINQIESWISDADKAMHGARAGRSDVVAMMTAALVAAGWAPGLTVKLSFSRISHAPNRQAQH